MRAGNYGGAVIPLLAYNQTGLLVSSSSKLLICRSLSYSLRLPQAVDARIIRGGLRGFFERGIIHLNKI